MSVDNNQLRRILNSFEPNYAAITRMGPAVLPALAQLARGSDVGIASRAVYAAGLFNDPRVAGIIAQAARHASALVRLTAADATRNTRAPGVNQTILALTRDSDPGVRKFAIKSAAARPGDAALAARVRALQTSDPSPTIRALASRATRGGGPGGNVA
jgi:HEAT repeat protein